MRFAVRPTPARHLIALDCGLSIQPLLAAVAQGRPITPVLLEMLAKIGFDSFTYVCLTEPQPNRDSRYYSWTTQPQELIEAYDRNAFLEVDPRVSETWGRTTPYIWDAATIRGGPAMRYFLDYMSNYGIRSGVAIPISDGSYARIGVGFNSNVSPVETWRRLEIERMFGSLEIFAAQFHDHLVAEAIRRGDPPSHQGAPLSPRELECLALAANGLTSIDVGSKLGISDRTANFHFANIVSKMGVLNRSEAVAKAISLEIIKVSAWQNGRSRRKRAPQRNAGTDRINAGAT